MRGKISERIAIVGGTYSGRNPSNVPVRRWRQGVFIRKERGKITWLEKVGVSVDVNKVKEGFSTDINKSRKEFL